MSEIHTSGVIISEKRGKDIPGFGVIAILLAIGGILGGAAVGFMGLIQVASSPTGILTLGLAVLRSLVGITASTMFSIIAPGEAIVTSFFGNYTGTIRKTGLVATLPFLSKTKRSVKDQNFETPVSKVNDANGNPVNVSAIVVWRLKDTAKATYAVENAVEYLETQAESAVRHVVASHPYDAGVSTPSEIVGDETEPAPSANKVSLLGGAETVNKELLDEISERTVAAGVEILEVRINNLAYSVEIAQAMLQRQQAAAVVDARKIIVEGAIGIVENAVAELKNKVPDADIDHGTLASNLLIVLVGENKVSPMVDVAAKNKK